jgi:hypothetical protein
MPIPSHPELSGVDDHRYDCFTVRELFTPSVLVEAMHDLVRSESEWIDARFLGPACGSGNWWQAPCRGCVLLA